MTLTRKAVEKKWNTSPSWTRDEWISEVVFNQSVREVPWIGKYVKNEKTGHEYILSSYSTDISAAWEVVEKMRKTHWVDISGGLKLHLVSPYTCQIGVYGVPGSLYADGETAPEAICKAAILAVLNL